MHPARAVTLASRMSLQPLIDRARAVGAERLNAVLAVVLGVEMQAEAFAVSLPAGQGSALHALLFALALAFGLRRRFPVLTLVAAQVVFVTASSFGKTTDNIYVPLFVVLFLNVSAAIHTEGRRFWLTPV